MKKFAFAAAALLVAGAALAADSVPAPTAAGTPTVTISFDGFVSPYVELNKKESGDTAVGVFHLGESGPAGSQGADGKVSTSVPLQMRSNVGYTLKAKNAQLTLQTAGINPTNIGFAIDSVSARSGNLHSGSDVNATSLAGASQNSGIGAWQYDKGFDKYQGAGATVLSGSLINDTSLISTAQYLTANATIEIRKQFFTPGGYAGTVTLELSQTPVSN